MTTNLSTAVRGARAEAIETQIGTAPKLLLFSGSKPANCAAADPSGLLGTWTLPSDWLTSDGVGGLTKNGTWSGTFTGSGVIASWRIKNSGETVCHWQGSASEAGGGGDMIFDNTDVNAGQTGSVSSFAWTDGNG